MGKENTYVFNDQDRYSGRGSGVDLTYLLNGGGACNNGFGNGFGGDGIWAILLLSLLGRGGFGGYGGHGYEGGYGGGNHIPEILAGDAGREMLMNAIQGNGQAISSLASNLNCSVQQIETAICGINQNILGLSKDIGMSSLNIINSINSGNAALASQLCQCCCETQNLVLKQGYENQLANCNQTNVLLTAGNQNTLQIVDNIRCDGNTTRSEIASFRQAWETKNYNDLLAEKTRLQTVIDLGQQQNVFRATVNEFVAPVNARLAHIDHVVEEIKCHELPTYAQPYVPGAPITFGGYNYGRPFGYDHDHGHGHCNDGCNGRGNW